MNIKETHHNTLQEKLKSQQFLKREMAKDILIDFFLVVGLPKTLLLEMLDHVDANLDKDYFSERTFRYIQDKID
jgi:hypothetical protein